MPSFLSLWGIRTHPTCPPRRDAAFSHHATGVGMLPRNLRMGGEDYLLFFPVATPFFLPGLSTKASFYPSGFLSGGHSALSHWSLPLPIIFRSSPLTWADFHVSEGPASLPTVPSWGHASPSPSCILAEEGWVCTAYRAMASLPVPSEPTCIHSGCHSSVWPRRFWYWLTPPPLMPQLYGLCGWSQWLGPCVSTGHTASAALSFIFHPS